MKYFPDIFRNKKDKNAVFDIHPRRGPGWNRPRRTVSLRRRFYNRHPVLSASGALALVLIAVLTADTFLGHANTVYWYPSTCLGGWTAPQNAAETPDLLPGADPDEFTADNSAVLEDSVSQIFCGGWSGDTPEGSAPTAAILRLSWAFKTVAVAELAADDIDDGTASGPDTELNNGDVMGSEATSTAATSTAGTASTTESLESLATTTAETMEAAETTEVEKVTEDMEAATTADVVAGSASEESSEEPAAALEPGADVEQEPEQDPEQSTEPEPTPVPEPAPALEDDTPAEPAAYLLRLVSTAFAQEAVTTTSGDGTGEILGTGTTGAETEIVDGILEVRYSFDGQNWRVLGTVGAGDWQEAQYEVPVSSWADLQTLQIALASFPVADAAPAVYLDGMSLAVEHELTPADKEEIVVEEAVEEEQATPVENINIYDPRSKHFCSVEPFTAALSTGGSLDLDIRLFPSETEREFRLRPGSPAPGLEMELASAVDPAEQARLTVTASQSALKGSFNMVIIYEEIQPDGEVLPNYCQFNLVIA